VHDDRYIRRALAQAMSECGGNAKPKDVVFRALEIAVEIDGELPERGGPSTPRTLWPPVERSYNDRIETYQAIVFRILNGEASADELETRRWLTPEQVSEAEAVLDNFRTLVIGPTPVRDWKILCGLAKGHRSGKVKRALGMRCTGAAIRDIKRKQCAAIAKQLSDAGVWPDKVGAQRTRLLALSPQNDYVKT
jgi:hypothetical protein